jgi:hypothetical protein
LACDLPRKIARSGKRAKDYSAQKTMYTYGRAFRLRQAGEGRSKASVGGRGGVDKLGKSRETALAMPLLALVSEPSPCRLCEVSNYGCKSCVSGISQYNPMCCETGRKMRLVNERTRGKNSDVSGVISPKENGKQTRPRSRLLYFLRFSNSPPFLPPGAPFAGQRRMKEVSTFA